MSSPRPWKTRRNAPLARGAAVVGAGGKHTSPPFDDLDSSQDDNSQDDDDSHLDDLDVEVNGCEMIVNVEERGASEDCSELRCD